MLGVSHRRRIFNILGTDLSRPGSQSHSPGWRGRSTPSRPPKGLAPRRPLLQHLALLAHRVVPPLLIAPSPPLRLLPPPELGEPTPGAKTSIPRSRASTHLSKPHAPPTSHPRVRGPPPLLRQSQWSRRVTPTSRNRVPGLARAAKRSRPGEGGRSWREAREESLPRWNCLILFYGLDFARGGEGG